MPGLQEVECMEVSNRQTYDNNSLETLFQIGNLLIVEPLMGSDLQNLLDENKSEKRFHRMTASEILGLDVNEINRWNSHFDAVVCDSLDDVIDVFDLLKSISGMLKSEGRLFLQIQNTKHRSVVDNLLKGSWRQSINRQKPRRYYTKREIEKLLFRAGFDISEIRSDENEEFKNWKTNGNSTFFRIGRLQTDRLKDDEIEEFYTKDFSIIATKSVEKSQPLTSIIILTHNQVAYTRMCIDSIRRYTDEPFELIVVDNASDDATIAYLKSLDNVKLIFNQTNRGFPAAVNQGIELATGEYLLLLNNDTIVTTGWLQRMQEAMQRETNIGLVGPCSNNVSGPQQVDCQLADLTCLDGFDWERGKKFSNRTRESERLVGFCLLIKRDVIEKIGTLDERFGTGCFEDDDFCRRAIEAGFDNVIADDSFVYHFGSITFRNSNVDFGKLMQENREKFEEKWNDDALATQKEENAPSTNWKVKASETGGLLLEKKTCKISLCMIVRDNENTIEPCLKSIQPWVDEIIVVDTGSLDRTPELCEKYGAKLFRFPWCDDFSRARNESLKYASGEWLF